MEDLWTEDSEMESLMVEMGILGTTKEVMLQREEEGVGVRNVGNRMQERQVTVKIGGRHPLCSALLGITLQFMVSKGQDASQGGAFAPRSRYGQGLSLRLSVLENTNICRFTESANACLCPKSGLTSTGSGGRLCRAPWEIGRGGGAKGQRVVPMESDHGMATGQDGARDETLVGPDHVRKRLLPNICRSAAHHRKQTTTAAMGYQNPRCFALIRMLTPK